METREIAKKGLYVGTGTGLILFVLVGFFSGSFIGGVIGLKISAALFSTPANAALLPRLIVAVSMVLGVITSAIVFVFGTGLLGWAAGFVLETLKADRMVEAKAAEPVRK